MTYVRSDDGVLSGRRAIVRGYDRRCRERMRLEREWVDTLRARNVRAAMPDDGWVDRQRNRFIVPSYATFDDGIRVGDLVALGTTDRFRLVYVVEQDVSRFGLRWWYFEELAPTRSGIRGRLAAKLRAAGERLVRFLDRR